MATCSSILAWQTPWAEEPGGLQWMGSHGQMTEQLSMHTRVWEDARIWAHWNHDFVMRPSYLGPVSCVFTSWVSSGLTTQGSRYSLMAAAAAAAKSLQSCPTMCNPIDGSPPGSIPGILQARTPEWVAISFSNAWKWKVKLLSRVRLLATPWTAAYQAPQSMGFPRQEYWSGVPFSSPMMQCTSC